MKNSQLPSQRISAARTFLFVPADRPQRFDKAAGAGADIVILDLEDAVAPTAKDFARDAARSWLASERGVLLRINAAGTQWFEADLALGDLPGVLGLLLPKAEAGAPLERVTAMKPTVALIESASGVATVHDIAAVKGVERLAFGTIDLALDIETSSDDVLHVIGTQLVIASRSQGIASPIDGVTPSLQDPSLVEDAMRASRKRGFGAKMCIHPAQLLPVRRAFLPTEKELDWARRVVEADRISGGAAAALEGQMIDRPLVAKAYRTIADAEGSSKFVEPSQNS